MGLKAVKLREASGVEKEGIIRPGAVRWRLSTLLALLCFKLIMSHRNPEKTCPSVHGEESRIVAQLANVPHTISRKKGGREGEREKEAARFIACCCLSVARYRRHRRWLGALVVFLRPPSSNYRHTYVRTLAPLLFSLFPLLAPGPPPPPPLEKEGGGWQTEKIVH